MSIWVHLAALFVEYLFLLSQLSTFFSEFTNTLPHNIHYGSFWSFFFFSKYFVYFWTIWYQITVYARLFSIYFRQKFHFFTFFVIPRLIDKKINTKIDQFFEKKVINIKMKIRMADQSMITWLFAVLALLKK